MRTSELAAPDQSHFPLGRVSLIVAGTAVAALELLRRIRAARRAAQPKVGYVSEEWLAQHRASSDWSPYP